MIDGMNKDILSKKFNLDARLTDLLIQRGIDTAEKISKFLNPDLKELTPIEDYKGVFDASKRILQAIENREKILIYGDYDCDGICSVAMLYLFLKSNDIIADYYIPNRHNDGYGINLESVFALNEQLRPDLMITVDCGISSHKEISRIKKEIGIDVIVTDHHILPEILPECIIFNPKVEKAYDELSGAGVVLRLIEAIAGRKEMEKYIDIAAISTIADIVPLTDDNRIITALGIEKMRKSPRRGIKLLADIAKADYIASDIAFKMAPRINASGRLADANKVVELFISDDYFLLSSIVKEIDRDNRERRALSEQLYCDALIALKKYDLINNNIIILHNESWDIGILGIAAAKIAREFMRPAILMTSVNGFIKGSGRSVEGINLYQALLPFKDKYISFGGHSQAVGITIDKFNYDIFVRTINGQMADYNMSEILNTEIDAIELDLKDNKIFHDLKRLEPFGCGNTKPIFRTNIKPLEFKSITNTNHIKAQVKPDIEIVGFNMLSSLNLFASGVSGELIIDLNINKYNGNCQGIINQVNYSADKSLNDFIESQFIKQLLYKDKCRAKYIIAEHLDEIPLDNKFCGTLFIASRMNSCYNVLKYYKDNLDFEILAKRRLNPLNCIILAPQSGEVSMYYRRLVFVDKPLSEGYIDRFVSSNTKEIYVIDNRHDILLNMDISRMDSIHQVISDVAKSVRVRSLDDLYLKVNRIFSCSYLEFTTVFYIMYEQQIMSVDRKFNINIIKAKIDYNKSKIFRRINGH